MMTLMRDLSVGCYISTREANGPMFVSPGEGQLDQSLFLPAVKAFVLHSGADGEPGVAGDLRQPYLCPHPEAAEQHKEILW